MRSRAGGARALVRVLLPALVLLLWDVRPEVAGCRPVPGEQRPACAGDLAGAPPRVRVGVEILLSFTYRHRAF